MFLDKTGSPIGMILVGIILTLTLKNLNECLATTSKGNTREHINCEEDPPYCYGWFDADDANENAYFQSNDSFDARHLHYLINSSSSQPVCALDPFEATSIHYVNASVMVMDIHCSEPGTRIVMKLGPKNISSPLVWLLWVTNCSIYWKDISKLGKHIVIVSMLFVDWQDEFMTGEPEYFNACVHLKQRNGDKHQLGMKRSIEGCSGIAEIRVQNTIARTFSSVFASNLWPALTGLELNR